MSRPVFNVMNYGAAADGRKKDTAAFAAAMAAAGKAGGGVVFVPAGIYLTGPINIASNVELRTEKGVFVQFSRDYADYPLILGHWEGVKTVRCTSPLNSFGQTNIAITGQGIFDGAGEAWRPVKKVKMTDEQWTKLLAGGGVVDSSGNIWWPTEAAMKGAETVKKLRAEGRSHDNAAHEAVREYLRPVLMSLVECRNIVLDGPTFRNSPGWNVHPVMCENITIRNVTVTNPWWSQNGDGLDLDSCRNAVVSDSMFDVGDDAICIKSGRDAEGRRRNRPSENINIVNCTVIHGHGGVTIGSEMSGGVRNVTVTNCDFRTTDVGLRFKTTRGRGGIVENIRISNVTMSGIKNEAITLDMYYAVGAKVDRSRAAHPVTEETPRFRNIHMSNITCDGAARAMVIRGLPEMPIEAVTLEHVRMTADEGIFCTHARDIRLRDVRITTRTEKPFVADEVEGLETSRLDVRVADEPRP
ncbi:MAG TPA: glycoside hydrolase family 28 protein [Sedimentisphaerales bacterium]|nr:glycoside hydrolase family 28 protein [Sedimentisphaerales bacterium]